MFFKMLFSKRKILERMLQENSPSQIRAVRDTYCLSPAETISTGRLARSGTAAAGSQEAPESLLRDLHPEPDHPVCGHRRGPLIHLRL